MTTLLEAVEARLTGVARMYPVNEVPPSPEYPYGVYSALLGGGGSYTLDSETRLRHGIATLQAFGRTTASTGDHLEKAVTALLDAQLTFDDYNPSTPLRAFLDQPALGRDPDDDGVVTATMPFTFTATKETP